MTTTLTLRPKTSATRCAWCHGELRSGVSCLRCGSVVHEECRELTQGCVTLGCEPEIRVTSRPSWIRTWTLRVLPRLFFCFAVAVACLSAYRGCRGAVEAELEVEQAKAEALRAEFRDLLRQRR